MSYYMGDFYRGDFYRGDPGFFSFLGKAIKGIAGSVLGFGVPAAPKVLALPGAGAIARVGGITKRVGRVVMKHPVLSAAGAAGTIGALGAGISAAERARGVPGRRRRRMHVTNVKALRRSLRRVQGFAKLSRRVLHFTSPRAARGRPVFRAIRRKKRI